MVSSSQYSGSVILDLSVFLKENLIFCSRNMQLSIMLNAILMGIYTPIELRIEARSFGAIKSERYWKLKPVLDRLSFLLNNPV